MGGDDAALIGRRQVRLVLGALWLLDAALQLQPLFFAAPAWRVGVAQSVMGEPGWVARPVILAIGIISAHPAAWNGVFVAVQAALGLALVTDRLPRVAIATSIPYAVGVWWVGEGFGVLPTGFAQLFAGSPGPAVLYPVLGLLAWPTPHPGQEPAHTMAGDAQPDEGRTTGWSPDGRPAGERRRHPRRPGDRSAGDRRPVARRAALACWAAVWAGQAVLLVPWVYPSGQMIRANFEENGLDAPGWLLPAVHQVSGATSAHAAAVVAGLAVLQLAVGLGVLVPTARRPALAAGLVATAAFWVVGQDFGGLLTAGATDPGTAPLVALLGLSLWPRSAARPVASPTARRVPRPGRLHPWHRPSSTATSAP